VDEVVDDSLMVHSKSIFQYLSYIVLNVSELKTMEIEWRHELDEILDSIDDNANTTTKSMVRIYKNLVWLVSRMTI
jgi:hypothetical protein